MFFKKNPAIVREAEILNTSPTSVSATKNEVQLMQEFLSATYKYEAVDIVNLCNIKQVYNAGAKNEMVIFDGTFNLDIKDISNQSQTVGLLGPSGCGKTTLLNYISGLQKPTSGEIFMNGKPQTSKDRAGMIFQGYGCYPWMNVLDYVMLPLKIKGVPKKEARQKAEEMLVVVGLEKHMDKYAQHGILSGGQLQRVAIAASLVANEQILLMDEPFGALDSRTRSDMQDKLLDICKKIHPTIGLVTHDIAEAVYLCDIIVILEANPGRIVKVLYVNDLDKTDRRIKRSPEFCNHVYMIEDITHHRLGK